MVTKLEAEVVDASLYEELVVTLTTCSLPVDPVGVGVSAVVATTLSVVVGVEWCLGQILLSSASLTIAAGCCKPMEIYM